MTSDPKNSSLNLLTPTSEDVGIAIVHLSAPLGVAEREAVMDQVQDELLEDGIPLTWVHDHPEHQLKLVLHHEYNASTWQSVLPVLTRHIGPTYNVSLNAEQLLNAAAASDLSGVPLERLMAYREHVLRALEAKTA